MLTRSIDPENFGPTFEEKLFRRGKYASIALAVVAIGIATLDLLNASAVTSIAAAIRDSRMNYAEMPERVLASIRSINVYDDRSSVVVAIPRDTAMPKVASVPPRPAVSLNEPVKTASKPEGIKSEIVRAELAKLDPVKPAPKAEAKVVAKVEPLRAAPQPAFKTNSPAVAALADVRHADAVEFAMTDISANVRPPVTLASLPSAAPISLRGTDDDLPPARLASFASASPSEMAASVIPDAMPITLPPIHLVPLPTAAPGVPPPSPAQRLKLDEKGYAKAERCLANAIYWEARSEPVRGQMAVAQVVINRVFSPFYPDDVCGVVYQNAHRHLSCQFTFACDGKRKTITERGHWARANRIAKQTLDGQIYVPEVAKSTHYHASYVNPIWNREMKKLVKFGLHSFYRPWAWGNGDDAPAWGKPLAKTAMAKQETLPAKRR